MSTSLHAQHRRTPGSRRSTKRRDDPTIVELLAERFAVETGYVPRSAQRIRMPEDLSPTLERLARRAERDARAWLAWTAEPRTWFLMAERDKAAHQAGAARLRLYFYDADARPAGSGTWSMDANQRWTLVNPH